jgi:hypothetical protein
LAKFKIKKEKIGRVIHMLFKVFKEESHRDDFLNGRLYMNRLKFFKKLEDKEINSRNDSDEAVSGWYQPNKGSYLKVNEHIIPSEDINGPIKVGYDKFDDLNVFCLSVLYSNEFEQITEGNLNAYRNSLLLNNKMLELGDYCVILTNPSTFIENVKSSIQRNKLYYRMGLVEYFDPNIFHGTFSGIDAVFRKQIQFSYQKEYRIVIDSKTLGDNPYILETGNIRDICLTVRTNKLNSKIEVKLS